MSNHPPHRIPGTSFAAQRDARARIERQRREEREAIRAQGGSDITSARVTICPPADAAAEPFGQRISTKHARRRSSRIRRPHG